MGQTQGMTTRARAGVGLTLCMTIEYEDQGRGGANPRYDYKGQGMGWANPRYI